MDNSQSDGPEKVIYSVYNHITGFEIIKWIHTSSQHSLKMDNFCLVS